MYVQCTACPPQLVLKFVVNRSYIYICPIKKVIHKKGIRSTGLHANSPMPTGELAYVGEFVVPHSCVKCVVKCVSTCVSTFCSYMHINYASFCYPLPSQML